MSDWREEYLNRTVECPDCGSRTPTPVQFDGDCCTGFWVCSECGTVHKYDGWYRWLTLNGYHRYKETGIIGHGKYVYDTGIEVIGIDAINDEVIEEEFPDMTECLSWLITEKNSSITRTKRELDDLLAVGFPLNQLLALTDGQDCTIYKAPKFVSGNVVLYIPDIGLNDISVDRSLFMEHEQIENIIGNCYDRDDFLHIAEDDIEKAEELFWYCDWQHPSSAVDEIWDDEEEEDEEDERPTSDWNKGAASARDRVLSIIIGLQNECHPDDLVRYSALQSAYNNIIIQCGDMFQPYNS